VKSPRIIIRRTHHSSIIIILYLKHVNTQRKVYHSIPLHTYTANFATPSTLLEMLLTYKLISNDTPFAYIGVCARACVRAATIILNL